MNNLYVTKMDNMSNEDIVRREMGELEIYGAMLYMYQLVSEFNKEAFGENHTTIDDIDNATYYANKTLEVAEGGFLINLDNGQPVILDSVFMIEGNRNDLWGYAYNEDDEEQDLFLVRI